MMLSREVVAVPVYYTAIAGMVACQRQPLHFVLVREEDTMRACCLLNPHKNSRYICSQTQHVICVAVQRCRTSLGVVVTAASVAAAAAIYWLLHRLSLSVPSTPYHRVLLTQCICTAHFRFHILVHAYNHRFRSYQMTGALRASSPATRQSLVVLQKCF